MMRRVLLATALTTTALAILPATPAQAMPCGLGHSCSTTYYSDDSHTTAVGGEWTDCDGYTVSWGVRGGYSTRYDSEC
ncbi:DUF6289 family protein [Streptosporangium sp. NPDC051023]|uniref:DUF6289 family protein n=1 Tax=Streptosporangium sp. NPDC051023 TaxID=3155410 RepID=UPI00344B6449